MNRWLGLAASIFIFLPLARAASPCAVTATSMSLGNYTGTLLIAGTSQVTVTCKSGDSYNIGLSAGTGAGATTANRMMTGPTSATLSYQMFQDAARAINWGNTAGTDSVKGSGPSSTFYIYPQVPAGQNPTPGTYTDIITVTVNSAGGSVATTFTVTAIVQANCFLSAGALNFGTYSGSLVNASSILTVSCTNLAPFDIGLNAGTASGATVSTRRMTGPASATLGYSMFQDGAHSLNWGNTVGTDTFARTGTGAAVQYAVYGQIPAGQLVAPGTYTDTIVATVTY